MKLKVPRKLKVSQTQRKTRVPWYVRAFRRLYLQRYSHRSEEAAQKEVKFALPQLKLKRGDEVLDLCCGAGRHSRALAARGFNVVAIDLSADLLKAAAEQKHKGNSSIQYIRADMRRLPIPDKSVSGAISMFTSFGYFSNDAQNLRVLNEVARVLKPGGSFLMDYFNINATLKMLVPTSERSVGDVHLLEKRRFDSRKKRLIKTVRATRGSQTELLRESVRAYSLAELKALFRRAGLTITKVFGDLSGASFKSSSSPRCVLLAHKPGSAARKRR